MRVLCYVRSERYICNDEPLSILAKYSSTEIVLGWLSLSSEKKQI